MRKETKQRISIGCLALGLFLAASPFLMSYAQKKSETQKVENQDDQTRQARQEIAKSVVGSLFLDAITVKEPEWKLKKGHYQMKRGFDDSNGANMSFENGGEKIYVGLNVFDSAENASKLFHIPRSHGASVKFNTYGDEGEKIYLQTGDFVTLNFRQGNFFVGIQGRDEKTSELFAAYVVEAIKAFSAK